VADSNKKAAASESEDTVVVATKSYTIKDKASINVIKDGANVRLQAGDSVDLTEAQAIAFKDKIEDAPTDPNLDPLSLTVGEETGARATINEASADIAEAQGLGKETPEIKDPDAVDPKTSKTGTQGSTQSAGDANAAKVPANGAKS
jgi:hypothetical protein